MKQEICSRPYLQALMKLVNNPKTHVTVKNRILDVIQTWATDFKGEPTLDYMNEVYNELKSQGHSFPTFAPSPKQNAVSDREREEEDLQCIMNSCSGYGYIFICATTEAITNSATC